MRATTSNASKVLLETPPQRQEIDKCTFGMQNDQHRVQALYLQVVQQGAAPKDIILYHATMLLSQGYMLLMS